MKFLNKLAEFWESVTFKVPKEIRIGFVVLLVVVFGSLTLNHYFGSNEPEIIDVDENVYLYEEVVFAGEIYIKCTGINAIETEGVYTLNLQLRIEQVDVDGNPTNQEIKPELFKLKLVDKNAKSPMSVFVESLARATVSVIASGAIGGDINVIEETVGFAADYVEGVISNSSSGEEAISPNSDQFVEFLPSHDLGNVTTIELSFELTEGFLNSTKTMVLSMDAYDRWEKNIFLVLRPNTSSYTVNFDLNGGHSDEPVSSILVESGEIVELPSMIPTKSGYQFLYWTTTLNDISTRVRDLYLHTGVSLNDRTLYAYYQEIIPLDEYVNIGESIEFKEGVYSISVSNYDFADQVIILNKDRQAITSIAPDGKKYLIIHLSIMKALDGYEHKLDNSDDFFLKSDHTDLDASQYFGYSYNKSIKPISDYAWIGTKIDEIGLYEVALVFEVDLDLDLESSIAFLEIDFFRTAFAKSILLKID